MLADPADRLGFWVLALGRVFRQISIYPQRSTVAAAKTLHGRLRAA